MTGVIVRPLFHHSVATTSSTTAGVLETTTKTKTRIEGTAQS